MHLAVRWLGLLLLLAGLAVAGLAWRLSRGPLDVAWAVPRLERAFGADDLRIAVSRASLAWEGFTNGVDRPLDIRIGGLEVTDPTGRVVLSAPVAEISLSVGALLLGQVVPRALALEGATLRLRRDRDGAIGLDTIAPAAPGGTETPRIDALLAELARPPQSDLSADAGRRFARLAQFRRIRLRQADVTMDDRMLGATWQLRVPEFDVLRQRRGGLVGQAEATLSVGGEQATAKARLSRPDRGVETVLDLSLTSLRPARLAAIAPALAPLAALDAPVTLTGGVTLGRDLHWQRLHAEARVGEGRAFLADGSVLLGGAKLAAIVTPARAEASLSDLLLLPRPGARPTRVFGRAEATRQAGRVQATLALELDQAAFADLPELWPEGLGGSGARPWITQNITAGIARNGHLEVALSAPEDLSDATLDAVSGGIEGTGLAVHWLRPVPPIQQGEARLTFAGPDTIDIAIASGVQAPGQLAIRGGHVRLTGLSGHEQFARIDGDLAGPAADLLTLLKEPRLKLFARRPLDIRDVSGQVAGHLAIPRLPLRADVGMEEVAITGTGKLTDLRVPAVVAGRDLDRGAADFEASVDGLKARGTAQLAGIPAQLAVEMDFRAGPATQVVQKATASGAATAKQLAAAGLDTADLADGTAALQVTALERRNGSGEVSARAELSRAVLDVPWLGFRKPAGQPAEGEARLLLDRGRITGLDRLRLSGDALDVQADAIMAGNRIAGLRIARAMLGRGTSAQGEVRFPQRAGEPWVVQASGPRLDLSARFSRRGPAEASADTPGPPWNADVRFDSVRLGTEDRVLAAVVARAESDGRTIRRATIQAHAGGAVRLQIEPRGGTRVLTGSAEDAGALLRAFDVMDDMQGGRLTLSGTYDDRVAGNPLSGSAEIDEFRIRNAPGLAKVLQGMTLYGLVQALGGPGLGFTRLVAPFRIARDTLDLFDARAFNPSLGMTAKGRVDLGRRTLAVEGTIVPAYFFNSLLGEIPLIGRIFSPEKGGGLFAASYTVRGPMDDPSVSVNPLAALTPGFLRGLFSVFDGPTGPPAPQPPEPQHGRGGQN